MQPPKPPPAVNKPPAYNKREVIFKDARAVAACSQSTPISTALLRARKKKQKNARVFLVDRRWLRRVKNVKRQAALKIIIVVKAEICNFNENKLAQKC